LAQRLSRLWRRLGAFAASCAERAQKIVGHDGYFVTSHCNGVLRAVAIVSPGNVPLVFLFRTAAQVLPFAQNGELISIEEQRSGDGELVTAQTDGGTYGLLRAIVVQAPRGRNIVPPRSCVDVADTEPTYSILPPSAVDLLARAARDDGWAWPTTAAIHGQPPFELRTGTGLYYEPKSGTIECTTDELCEIHRRGRRTVRGRPHTSLSLDHLAALAPPP
jgi:hypothetical protein